MKNTIDKCRDLITFKQNKLVIYASNSSKFLKLGFDANGNYYVYVREQEILTTAICSEAVLKYEELGGVL